MCEPAHPRVHGLSKKMCELNMMLMHDPYIKIHLNHASGDASSQPPSAYRCFEWFWHWRPGVCGTSVLTGWVPYSAAQEAQQQEMLHHRRQLHRPAAEWALKAAPERAAARWARIIDTWAVMILPGNASSHVYEVNRGGLGCRDTRG